MTDRKTPESDSHDVMRGSNDPAFLDAYFDAGRSVALVPSDRFMARLQHDAQTQQATNLTDQRSSAAAKPRSERIHRGAHVRAWWQRGLRGVVQWAAPMGGAPGIAGLASVALAGIWLGFVAPAPVSALETWVIGADADFIDAEIALLSEIDTFLSGDAANEY